jgi:signal transduction histidine kinase
VLDTGVPTFTGSTFSGYVGSVVDVTSLAVARSALSNLSRRLMHAHEEAQAAVSKKLQEDLCQRMILLTLRLHRLKTVSERGEVHAGIEELSDQLAAVASELFNVCDPMFERLKLLGLAAACRMLCEEASKKHGTVIEFRHDGVPPHLPDDLSLALFRVLQEAIVNGVNHAAIRGIDVSLTGTASEICLDIAGFGSGFGSGRDTPDGGVGLVGIRERLESLEGGCTIESSRDAGTRVRAWLPLPTSPG